MCAGVNDAKHTSATAAALVKQLGDPASLSEKDLLALFCLGELGKAGDLSAVAGVEAALLGALDAPGEELKSAASVALGGVATGGRGKFLPMILSHVANESHKHQYSLFLSLREVIRNGGVGTTRRMRVERSKFCSPTPAARRRACAIGRGRVSGPVGRG